MKFFIEMVDFGDDKDILIQVLEDFHDAVLKNEVCENKLWSFDQYIKRIVSKHIDPTQRW